MAGYYLVQFCDFHRTTGGKYRLFSIKNQYYRLFSIKVDLQQDGQMVLYAAGMTGAGEVPFALLANTLYTAPVYNKATLQRNIIVHSFKHAPVFPIIFEQRTSKRAQVSVFLYTAAAYRPMGPADAFKESSIDESVPRRPGGGERVRWRCCSSRGRTADRPTAPDTAEHIDYQSIMCKSTAFSISPRSHNHNIFK